MPQIIDVFPEEINVVFKMTLTEVKKLKLSLDCSKMHSNDDREREAVEYTAKEFYPTIEKMIEQMEGGR